MRMVDVIRKKRDGQELTKDEIDFFIKGYVEGQIPDYQVSALLMAIYYKGMNDRETADLTFAIRDSGDRLDFSKVNGIRVDKHSTGGVGDKTSLVVAPIVASLGVKVAKMSGRGLGHTGGTIDKLEAIPGFNTEIEEKKFIDIVNDIGICIVGQSKELAPADKKLYALRDVTSTVDSLPLIVSSIMGKKLAADDDCIVLDVKSGSGALCKTVEESKKLAKSMVDIGNRAGKAMRALITDMDRPLGNAIGNSLEVIEAVKALKGEGPKDLEDLCVILATNMLSLAKVGTYDECKLKVKEAIANGSAFDTFVKMVEAQGGDSSFIKDVSKFSVAPYTKEVKADKEGFICQVNTEKYGMASVILGAGRNRKEDNIDYSAGIMLNKKTGDYVYPGDVIATLYTSNESALAEANNMIILSTKICKEPPIVRPLVLGIVQ